MIILKIITITYNIEFLNVELWIKSTKNIFPGFEKQ